MPAPKPLESFDYRHFVNWPPLRQRKWLNEMNTKKAHNQLSQQQIQTLNQCERAFAAGV